VRTRTIHEHENSKGLLQWLPAIELTMPAAPASVARGTAGSKEQLMRIVMLGAPGSGKGTQAKKLQTEFRLPQVSTGDLLRQAVADRTELGLRARTAMDAGNLVSDEIVLGMIRERISQADAGNGFILDGYPRNRQQAEDLATVFRDLGLELDAAVLMNVSTDLLMKRLTGRRTCSNTGKLLNIHFSPQAELDECLRNGGQLVQRDDDNEKTIANRLQVYTKQTEPLIAYYRTAGLLKTITAEGSVEEVYDKLVNSLGLK
jgi:adenylate kinase